MHVKLFFNKILSSLFVIPHLDQRDGNVWIKHVMLAADDTDNEDEKENDDNEE